MKTEMGKRILRINSKAMDRLNGELIELAKKLKELPRGDVLGYQNIMDAFKYNRSEHNNLQAEINEAIHLESFL